jgi:hypothetical protein
LEALGNDALLVEIAARSYHHNNGFDKIVLADHLQWKLRLHIWWPGPDRFCFLEGPHDHRWAFASKMLLGEYRSTIFKVVDEKHPGSQPFLYFKYSSLQRGTAAEQADKAKFEVSPPTTRHLLTTEDIVYAQGQSFVFPVNIIHRIVDEGAASKGGMTLIITAPSSKNTCGMFSDPTLVGSAVGDEAIPDRGFTVPELRTTLQRVLACLKANRFVNDEKAAAAKLLQQARPATV